MTKDDALKQALELLAVGTFHSPELQAKRTEVIGQGLEALAQPEQEPVGEVAEVNDNGFKCEFSQRLAAGTKLYTAPPQRPKVLFPTMLRKMWSGAEVQAWLDEHVNKENT